MLVGCIVKHISSMYRKFEVSIIISDSEAIIVDKKNNQSKKVKIEDLTKIN